MIRIVSIAAMIAGLSACAPEPEFGHCEAGVSELAQDVSVIAPC